MKAGLDYRWDEVKVFLAVMRERSLSGAAAKLGMDASTVSRRLVTLEEALGSKLFDRTRDGLSPSLAAEKILIAAEDLEAAALRLSHAAEERESAPEGVVRLTATPGLAEAFVVPELVALHARYPRLRVEVDASASLADLTRREADIAMRTVKPTSGDLILAKLMDLPHAALTSKAYAAEIGTLVDPRSARWIGWSHAFSQVPPARWLDRFAPGVDPVLRTSSVTAQIVAAESGLGVAILPRVYIALAGLVEVPFAGAMAAGAAALPSHSVWLVGHRALREVPRIHAVWTYFLEAAKRAPVC